MMPGVADEGRPHERGVDGSVHRRSDGEQSADARRRRRSPAAPGTSCGRSARSTSGPASPARRRSDRGPRRRSGRGTVTSSSGSRASARSTPSAGRVRPASRSRTGTTVAVPSERPPDVRSGSIGPNVQRSMIGLATSAAHDHVGCARRRRPVRTRRGVRSRPRPPAPRAGWRRGSRRSAAPSVTPANAADLDSRRFRGGPRAGLQEGIDEELAEGGEVVVVERHPRRRPGRRRRPRRRGRMPRNPTLSDGGRDGSGVGVGGIAP